MTNPNIPPLPTLHPDAQAMAEVAIEQAHLLAQITDIVGADPNEDDSRLPEKIRAIVEDNARLRAQLDDQ
ncbi:hypothetical protein [Mycobacteroides abscessus]|uniref:hypothetical protein n=1 Tax=Mycobacteroides abscessus TaxID=36809 RepID=UPI002106AD31|nr:hypothetical protein [Mycobacteroides abscessus]